MTQEEKNKALLEAAEEGDLAQVKALADDGADIHARAPCGAAPLHVAALGGSMKVVKFLLEKGADIFAKDKKGTAVLHFAILGGSMKVVKFLADAGADIHARNSDGETPLFGAANGGHYEIMEFLAQKGADVHAADNWRTTPLHRVTKRLGIDLHPDDMKIFGFLLAMGGEAVKARDHWGDTLLHVAARGGSRKAVEILLAKGIIDPCVRNVETGKNRASDVCGRYPEIRAVLLEAERDWEDPGRFFAALRALHRKLGSLRPKAPGL